MTDGAGKVAQKGFRADINGLRAWAVLAVILYHFNVPGFSGGFVGVDVFFVISGYLMTGIVIKGLELGRFSVFEFYAARARRILPALVVLCLVLLGMGYFFLAPPDYRQLATHAISAAAFFSNMKFLSEAGYFDVASHEKWLLHTWSLSVEWQFYLLLPLVLMGVWRLRPDRYSLLAFTGIACLVSFAASVFITGSSASDAFFLLPTRAWEMLAGGFVFLVGRRMSSSNRGSGVLETLGFVLIVASIVIFDAASAWPGWRAIVPVLGAMLVIAPQREHSAWTGHRIAQWLGDRSYSLYLWHWPVFVALAFVEQQDNVYAVAGGILLTLLLGHCSCKWIELPVRAHLGRLPRFQFWVGIGAVFTMTVAVALVIRGNDGLPGRLSSEVERVAAESANINPRRETCHASRGVESPSCVWGGGDAWRVIALGDSHTSAVVTAIAAAAGGTAGVVQWSYSGCVYVLGLKFIPEVLAREKKDYQCDGFVKWASARLGELPQEIPVVITNRYASQALGANENGGRSSRPGVYFSTPHETADQLFFSEFSNAILQTACDAAKHRRVYLVRPIPEMGFDVPKVLSRRLAFGLKQDVSISRSEYLSRNRWVWEAQDEAARRCGVKILDPTTYLCDEARCYGSRDLRPLYSDDDHLSESGNKLLAPMFRQIYDESISPPGAGS